MPAISVHKFNPVYSRQTGIFFLAFLFCSIRILSQNILIKGIIADEESKNGIPYATITSWPSNYYTVSDSLGNFEMRVDNSTEHLSVSILGYEKNIYKIPAIIVSNPLYLKISLRKKIAMLPGVTVFGETVAPVIENKKFYVLDYDILDEDHILALTYEINKKGGRLILTDNAGKIFSKVDITGEPVELFTDCYGNDHVVTDTATHQVYIEDDTLVRLMDKVSLQKFNQFLRPCVGKTAEAFFFEEKQVMLRPVPVGQPVARCFSLSYLIKGLANEEIKYFRSIGDPKMMALGKNEASFEAQKHAAGAYRPGPFGTAGHGAERDRLFTEMTLLKDICAPLFVNKDTVMIFNFPESKTEFYAAGGKFLKKSPLDFERGKYWKREVLHDKVQHKFYTLFDKNGVLSVQELNCRTGELNGPLAVAYPFVRKLKIVNGVLYFIKTDNEWNGTKYLYRQKIN